MFNTAFQAPFRALFDAAASVVYLLRDEFLTDEAAPIASPRTCEPGPGQLAIIDTANHLSISGGNLVQVGSVVLGNPRTTSTITYAKASGLCGMLRVGAVPTTQSVLGWGLNATGSGLGASIGVRRVAASVQYVNSIGGSIFTEDAVNFPYVNTRLYFVLRSVGGAFFIVGQKLLYVFGSPDYATPYFFHAEQGNANIDYMRITQLGSPWNDDFGVATARTASPTSGATITSVADAIHEFTWTPGAGETLEYDIRRTDDDNRWVIRCSQAGNTIKLIERTSGVETERSSAAQTWTAGVARRISVSAIGNIIRTFVADIGKNAYVSASFNNTATGVKISGFATGANLVAYPINLSGAALTALEAI